MTEDKKCLICGKSIADRASNARYCVECAKAVRKGYFKTTRKNVQDLKRAHRVNYRKELEARDTVMWPIKEKRINSLQTGNDYVYLICPSCNCVLNKSDRFCRFCGQRLKEDDRIGFEEM